MVGTRVVHGFDGSACALDNIVALTAADRVISVAAATNDQYFEVLAVKPGGALRTFGGHTPYA